MVQLDQIHYKALWALMDLFTPTVFDNAKRMTLNSFNISKDKDKSLIIEDL